MYFLVAGALRFAPASALHGTPFVLVIARPWLMDGASCWSVPTRLTPICIRALRCQPELPLRAAPREDVRCTVRCTALLPCSLREHWNARLGTDLYRLKAKAAERLELQLQAYGL
jgi:hypothetical protein